MTKSETLFFLQKNNLKIPKSFVFEVNEFIRDKKKNC